MVWLAKNVKHINVLNNLFTAATRILSTKVMVDTKQESNEVILKYLDGKDNGIVVLGINRPASRNAFGKNLVAQMSEAISTVKQDDKLRVLIIRSLVEKVFCAGADLRERAKMNNAETLEFVTTLRNLMNDIESVPAPVISAIDGVALGGGLELALATDIRIASSVAKMGLVETKLAIIPGAGGTQRLPKVVGVPKAKELIFTAKILDGEEAFNIGLVNQVVQQNKTGNAAFHTALSVAREIIPNGPIGVKLAKVAMNKGNEIPIKDGLEVECQCYSKLIDTKDRLEGLAAFVSKRAPIYRGV